MAEVLILTDQTNTIYLPQHHEDLACAAAARSGLRISPDREGKPISWSAPRAQLLASGHSFLGAPLKYKKILNRQSLHLRVIIILG